jgi:hypothetical protein
MRTVISTALLLGAVSLAQASIVLVGPAEEGGAGLGNRLTVLTLQSPANSTLETGCVGPGDSPTTCNTFPDSTVKTGNSQINAYTVGELGLSSFSQLRIIFNAADPGNQVGINLNAIALTIYSDAGASLGTFFFDADPNVAGNQGTTLDATFLGVGQEGYLFRLDAGQATAADAFLASTNVVGLGGSVGCLGGTDCAGAATGGLDTFSLAVAAPGDTPGDTPIPEPSAAMLLMSGVAAIAFGRKLRS